MKKITLAIFAVVIGCLMTSCKNVSPKETITKAFDNFFTKAEQELSTITTADEFMTHYYEFEERRDDFLHEVFADYIDEEGNIKGISESDMEEIEDYMYNRATAYNKVEAVKAAEFMEPLIAQYEDAVNALYDGVGNVDEETFSMLVDDFENAEDNLQVFADYDNVLPELQERVQAAEAKLNEVIAIMAEK